MCYIYIIYLCPKSLYICTFLYIFIYLLSIYKTNKFTKHGLKDCRITWIIRLPILKTLSYFWLEPYATIVTILCLLGHLCRHCHRFLKEKKKNVNIEEKEQKLDPLESSCCDNSKCRVMRFVKHLTTRCSNKRSHRCPRDLFTMICLRLNISSLVTREVRLENKSEKNRFFVTIQWASGYGPLLYFISLVL